MIFQKTLNCTKQSLKKGRNDTVHDFLAYLAERIIEMNKSKNEEIRGFLTWLQREIEAEIEDLTNKTALKEYHWHTFEHFIEVLKENKKKISADPSDRTIQEMLERVFSGSMTRLPP